MKTSMSDSEFPERAGESKAATLNVFSLVAGAVILICSSGSFAQDAVSKSSSQQSDAAATRLPKMSTEESSQDIVVSFKVKPEERPPATRRIFVRSKSLLVRAAVVEDKLLKRPEFHQLGFVITREESDADLILELRHDLLTMYVFTVVDAKTQTVLIGGKLSSLGGTVAGKVARRFVKDMMLAGAPQVTFKRS
jgi:hypothetical protein